MSEGENYTEEELSEAEQEAFAELNGLIANASQEAVGSTMYLQNTDTTPPPAIVTTNDTELQGEVIDSEEDYEPDLSGDEDEGGDESDIEEYGGHIGKASTSFLRMVEKIAEECYPGMWSIEPIKALAIQDRETKYLIIHFPELTISNRDRRQHIIRDMYAMFEIGDGVTGGGLYGIRRRNTLPEAVSGYAHSHLGQMALGMKISSFCMGNTSFHENILLLSGTRWTAGNTHWENTLQSFLFQLETYLSWESLEGGPYRRIAEITMGGNSADNVPTEELKSAFRRFLAYCRNRRKEWIPPISFDFERGKVELILDDEVEHVLMMCTSYHQHVSDGTFYSPRTMQLRDRVEKYIKLAQEFSFKGKIVPMVIDIPGRAEDEQEADKRKYAHRKIVNYVTAEFERLYREAWFTSQVPTAEERRIVIDFKRENYNQRRLSSAGTVFMSAD